MIGMSGWRIDLGRASEPAEQGGGGTDGSGLFGGAAQTWMETIRLWGEKVIPHFHKKPG